MPFVTPTVYETINGTYIGKNNCGSSSVVSKPTQFPEKPFVVTLITMSNTIEYLNRTGKCMRVGNLSSMAKQWIDAIMKDEMTIRDLMSKAETTIK